MEELIAYYPWLSLEVEAPAPARQSREGRPAGFERLPGAPRISTTGPASASSASGSAAARRESGYSLHVHLFSA